MMELTINSFLYGFVLALIFYFTGLVVPLIQMFARWR
jgi:hypothetical protein